MKTNNEQLIKVIQDMGFKVDIEHWRPTTDKPVFIKGANKSGVVVLPHGGKTVAIASRDVDESNVLNETEKDGLKKEIDQYIKGNKSYLAMYAHVIIGNTFSAESVCSLKDNYNRKTGANIALYRLLEKIDPKKCVDILISQIHN